MSPNPTNGLGILSRRVEAISDAVRTFPASRAEDSADARVTQGFVNVGQPILIATGQIVTHCVECVDANLDGQSPSCENLSTACEHLSLGCARGGTRISPDHLAAVKAPSKVSPTAVPQLVKRDKLAAVRRP
jgi:hypothetical protein